MKMKTETVIRRAEFNPKAKTYFIVTSCIGFVASVFGIILLPVWIPIAFVIAEKWFNSLECVLTEKTLRFKKGVLVKTEKTVPLDKITDLGSMQGPLMRALGIENMTIETAGSTVAGALLSLPGVIDPQDFRDAVLEQKEKLTNDGPTKSDMSSGLPHTITTTSPQANDEALTLLREIRDSLRNLELRGQEPTAKDNSNLS